MTLPLNPSTTSCHLENEDQMHKVAEAHPRGSTRATLSVLLLIGGALAEVPVVVLAGLVLAVWSAWVMGGLAKWTWLP